MSASGTELRYLVGPVDTWSPAKEAPDDPFMYVDLSSVDRELKEITSPQGMTGAEAPSRARQILKRGDVLVSTVRPNLNAVAHVPDEVDGATGSTGFCVLRADPEDLNSRYLFHWTRSPAFVASMVRRATGASYPAVSDRIVKQSKIPLPPLPEQQRIAAILDKANAVSRKRQQTLDLADQFLRSAFLDMFGDPFTNPKGWKRCPLGEVTSINAPMVDPRKHEYRHLLHYGPDRIEKHTGELMKAQTAEDDDLISVKYLCSPGEILYSKIRPYLNKVALVRQKCLCSADVYPVRPNEAILVKEYLVMLLRSAAFLNYVAGFSRRANIPKLNRKQFAGYEAPLPDLDLQLRFASIAESSRQQKNRQRSHLARLDTLFASLQQRAFRGEL